MKEGSQGAASQGRGKRGREGEKSSSRRGRWRYSEGEVMPDREKKGEEEERRGGGGFEFVRKVRAGWEVEVETEEKRERERNGKNCREK